MWLTENMWHGNNCPNLVFKQTRQVSTLPLLAMVQSQYLLWSYFNIWGLSLHHEELFYSLQKLKMCLSRFVQDQDIVRVNAIPVEVWGVLVYCWHRPLAHPIFTILYKELIHSPPTTDWLRTGFWILQIFKPKFCNSPELEPQISMNAQHRPPGARLYFPFSSKIPEAVEWFSSLQCPKSRHANYVWQYLEAAFLWIIHMYNTQEETPSERPLSLSKGSFNQTF